MGPMNKGSIVVAVLQRSWSFEPRYKLSTSLYFTLPAGCLQLCQEQMFDAQVHGTWDSIWFTIHSCEEAVCHGVPYSSSHSFTCGHAIILPTSNIVYVLPIINHHVMHIMFCLSAIVGGSCVIKLGMLTRGLVFLGEEAGSFNFSQDSCNYVYHHHHHLISKHTTISK